jgi:hypothetical protein
MATVCGNQSGGIVRNVYGQTGKVVGRQRTTCECNRLAPTSFPENWHVTKSFKQKDEMPN